MKTIDLSTPKSAIFSDDRKYRFALWRIWSGIKPYLTVIGLNPSVANEFRDDPTITRNIVRAYRTGFGGMFMANLYAYISTDPTELLKEGDFVGELTDYYLKEMIKLSKQTLCGWGSFPAVKNRADIVLGMLSEPYCLGVNKDGQPKHPLYISYETPIIKYEIASKGLS